METPEVTAPLVGRAGEAEAEAEAATGANVVERSIYAGREEKSARD